MAKKEEKDRGRRTQRVLNNPEIKKLRERIEDGQNKTTNAVYGSDQSFIDRNKADFDTIRRTIRDVSERYKSATGDSVIEFLTKMALEDGKSEGKGKVDPKQAQNKGLLNLNEVLENPNNGIVNELFLKEKSRLKLYDDYEALYEYIPQLAQAIEVFADNIMSPDDFTKDIFSIFYDGQNVGSTKDERKVISNIKHLEEMYKIEDKAKDWIRKALYLGEQFVAVLPLEREFNKILGEDGNIVDDTKFTTLNEGNLVLSETELKELEGIFNEGEDKDNADVKSDLIKLMNENIGYSENHYSVLKDEMLLENDFSSMNVREEFKSVRLSDLNSSEKKTKSKKEFLTDNSVLLNTNDEKVDKTIITGSFVKLLDPRKVVKIKMGETCFGYYYIETDDDKLAFTNNAFGSAASFQLRHATDMRNDAELIADPKSRLIVDVFARNLSKKLNKSFIQNNKEFKGIIYELVKQDYILKKRINIVYLPPDEVVHIKVGENSDGYGVSKFQRILFSAKLYLAVLTTTLMMKISRSADHRTFYIETGLSKDVEGIIQSFVREIKSKEVKLTDLKSIDSIFSNIGQFHDYFIPQVNGEKAIDIDTTPGQQTEIENDFLEYLKKTMISGMGIPATFLQYADEMEFARSVSMMNGMFLRTIVNLQKSLGDDFSNIYRKLYRNEFGEEEKNDDEEDFVVDYRSIEVKFPSPAALNLTNMADQITNVQGIVDFVVTTIVGGGSTDDAARDKLTKAITKQYLPNFEWEKFEELLKETSVEDVEAKLTPNKDNTTDEA